jgi:hypothetical protein
MNRTLRTIAFTTAAALLAGVAHADKIVTLSKLKKGAALPEGQAALLMVIDRGTQHSAVKRPEPVSFVIVSATTGQSFRLSDVDDETVRVIAPGKYFLKDTYSQSRGIEILGIHDASNAFEVKAGVLNYAGAWKFSNNSTKNTGSIGLEIAFAPDRLEKALKPHPGFVGAGKVFLSNVGQPATPLGGPAK